MVKRWIRILMGASLGLVLLAVPAAAVEPAPDATKLEAMAREAQTAPEHAEVARQYRLRAESLEAKAEEHEAAVRKIANRPVIGLEGKWPAMVRKPGERQRQLAMQARRGAREAYALADRHLRLAVETGFAEKREAAE
jgi:hypothetical protein